MQNPNNGKIDANDPSQPPPVDEEDVPNPPGLMHSDVYDLPPIYTPMPPPPLYTERYLPPEITEPPPYTAPPTYPPPPYFEGIPPTNAQIEEATEFFRDNYPSLGLVDKQFTASTNELEEMVSGTLYAFVMRQGEMQTIGLKRNYATEQRYADVTPGQSNIIKCTEYEKLIVRFVRLFDPNSADQTAVVRVLAMDTRHYVTVSPTPILLRANRNVQLVATIFGNEHAVCLLPENADINDVVENRLRETMIVTQKHVTLSLRPLFVYSVYLRDLPIAYISIKENTN